MPKFKVVFEDDAKIDIADSFDWYSEISSKVADNFLNEVKKALNYLQDNPNQFKTVYRDYKQVPVKKYPFVLLYKIDGQKVKIYRVFATRQNPKKRFK